MKNNEIAKAGSLLRIDSGAYSDYQVHGFFVVLQDFDTKEQVAQYLELNSEQRTPGYFEEYSFIAYLITKGLLLEIDYGKLYLGGYGSCDEIQFRGR